MRRRLTAFMLVAVLATLAVTAVEVTGSATCPSPADVASELNRHPPRVGQPGALAEMGTVAHIEQRDGGLSVAVLSEQGVVLDDRLIVEQASCADLASAAAVIIAAWQTVLPRDLAPPFPEAARSGVPSASLRIGQTTRVEDGGRPIDVGIATMAAIARDVAFGIEIDGALGMRDSGFAGRLAVSATTAHTLAVGPSPGRALWARRTLALGIRHRTLSRAYPIGLDLIVDARAGWVAADGRGFDENQGGSGLDFGAGAAARLVWRTRHFVHFVGCGVAGWSRRWVVEASGVGAQPVVPRAEAFVTVGTSIGRVR